RTLPLGDIVPMYVGATGNGIKAVVEGGAKGLVIQAVGSGHVNPEAYEAVKSAISKGLRVDVATRVPQGGTRACYGFDGSSAQLKQAGAFLAGELSAWKARVLLMLLLQEPQSTESLEAYFDQQC